MEDPLLLALFLLLVLCAAVLLAGQLYVLWMLRSNHDK